ncbi:MAG: Fic family protein, partial [Actinomycetota bacterium]|nr:Fic family protein [Actinomycetota bacterium]
VSVESVQQLLPVRGEAARTAILRLEEAGVLRQVTIGKRNRAWAAIEVLDLLDDFDSLVRSPGDP